jgi:hypothetical protein
VKDGPRGHHFAKNDELKLSVREELRGLSKQFHATGTQHLTKGWKKRIYNKEDVVEK